VPTASDLAAVGLARGASRPAAAPPRKSALATWAEFLIAAPPLALATVLPRRVALGIAAALGAVAHRLHRTGRRVAMINLAIAFPGELAPSQARRIARGAFATFFQTVTELVIWLGRPPKTVVEQTDCDGAEYFAAALASGRGVIVCSAHLGNWYWPAIYAAALGAPVHVVIRPLDNRLLDRWMNRILRRRGINPISRRGFAIQSAAAALRRGEVVGLMVDQNAAVGGRFVPFFGTLASTMRGAAMLRAITGCEVVCVHDVRRDGRHQIVVSGPMDLPDDEQLVLCRINRHFEAVIREHPESYLWMHPRWKKRPDDEATLYPGLEV
jgi:KDO2-lipid IV(A) lauroyltransferase